MMVRYDRIILVVLAVVLLVSLFVRSRPGSFKTAQATSLVAAHATSEYVQITGDVRHPGMYAISANKMAADAIIVAEPLRPVSASDLDTFAATPVVSGEAISVLMQPDGRFLLTRGVIPVAERLVMRIPLDINTMNETDFDRVPGIGPAMAQRIVAYRQKNGGRMSKHDLISVEGIGEKKSSALSKFFN